MFQWFYPQVRAAVRELIWSPVIRAFSVKVIETFK